MVLLRLSHSRAQVQYNIVKDMSLRERDKLQRTISPLAPLIAQPTFVNQYTHSATSWQAVKKTACQDNPKKITDRFSAETEAHANSYKSNRKRP